MKQVIDYVVKYYNEENPTGEYKCSGNDVNELLKMAQWFMTDEMTELFRFGYKVTIYPHKDERWANLNGVPVTGYTIEVGDKKRSWNIEPRVRESKPRVWMGEEEYKDAKSKKYYRDKDDEKKKHKVA